jgi:uncharacterized membrane protein
MTTAQIEEKRKRIMDKLPKTTLISFVVCAFLYLLLFLFLDRPVDLWVHNKGKILDFVSALCLC